MRISIKQLKSDIAGPILFQQDNTIKSNIIFRWNYGASRLEIGAADLTDTVLLNQGGLQFNTPTYSSTIYPRQNDSNFGNVLGNGAFEIASASAAGLLLGTITNKPVVLGTNNLPRIYIDADGDISLTSLAGGTTQMVVADVNGYLTKQNIPATAALTYTHVGVGGIDNIMTGTANLTFANNNLTITSTGRSMRLGGWQTLDTSFSAIYFGTPGPQNFSLAGDGTHTYLNAENGLGSVFIQNHNTTVIRTRQNDVNILQPVFIEETLGESTNYIGKLNVIGTAAANSIRTTINNKSATGFSSILLNENSTNFTHLSNYGTSYSGNIPGLALSYAGKGVLSSSFDSITDATGPLIFLASYSITTSGSITSNYGTRLDANGLRIGQLSTLHTANTAGTLFEAGYITMNTSGSILNITVSNQTEIGFSGGGVANIYHNTSGQEMSLGVNNGGLLFTADAFGHYSTAIYPTYIINSSTSTTSHFGTRLDANGFRIGAISSLGTINTYEFDVDGEIRATSQAGIGNRLVEANSLGVQSATTEITYTYITDTVVIDLLENSTNWDSNGNYIGTPITGTYEGQRHYDSTFLYECVSDNVWIRIITTFNAVPNLEIAFGTGTSLQSNSRFTITDLGITAKSKTSGQGYNYGYSPAFIAETNGNNTYPAFVFDKNGGSTKYGSILWQDEDYPALTLSAAGLHASISAYQYDATKGVFNISVQSNLGTTAPTKIFEAIGDTVNFGDAVKLDFNPFDIVFDANFSLGKVRIGDTGNAMLGIQSTSTTGYSGMIFGFNTSLLGAFYANGPSAVGNYAGTSVPIASVINLQAGNNYQYNLHLASGWLTAQTGTVTTNYGFRLDANGFRIGLNNTLHTANTQPFQVGTIRWYTGDYLYGGANLESFIQISAGPAQIGHFDTRNIYYNGSIASWINGANRMLMTPTTTTSYTDVVITTLAGTDDRMVEADATGLLTATTIIRDQWITDITTINLLEDINNWSVGEYIGTVITGTYEGQQNVDSNYYFLCISDNNWIRMARV